MNKEKEDLILAYTIITLIVAYLLGTIVQALSNLGVDILY